MNDYYDDDNYNEFITMKNFKSHNVLKERIEIYRDFTINLLHHIYTTYLGKKYINKDEDIIGHFNWCYNKVLEEFYEEEIDFYENELLYEYFFKYYQIQLYFSNDVKSPSFFENFWNDIFNYNSKNKSKKEFEVLLEIYKMFDSTFKEKTSKYLEEVA